MQIELLHAIQLVLMLFILITAVYHVAHNLRIFTRLSPDVLQYSEIISSYACSKTLTVVECESYHKYQIWRYFLFS
jgi:hypothetical protein